MTWGDVVCLEVDIVIIGQGAPASLPSLSPPTCVAFSIQGVGYRLTCSHGHSAWPTPPPCW